MPMRKRGTYQTFLHFCHVHQRGSVSLFRSAYSYEYVPEGSATRILSQWQSSSRETWRGGRRRRTTCLGVDLPPTATSTSFAITTSSSASASTSASQLESQTRNAAAASAVRVRATALGTWSHTVPKSIADFASRWLEPLNSSSPSDTPTKQTPTSSSVY